MNSSQQIGFVLKPLVFLVALTPVVLLVLGAVNNELGANPVETITFKSGDWGLRFLMLALMVTPLRRITGWNPLLRFRRMLGLFAFFYVVLHFSTFVVLDHFFSVTDIVEDIVKRPYITIGFTAFMLLIPLVITSTNAMVRRLGGQRWRRLHNLAYVATATGIMHFLWLVKADLRDPLIYLSVFLLLMILRLPAIANRLGRWRTRSETITSGSVVATF